MYLAAIEMNEIIAESFFRAGLMLWPMWLLLGALAAGKALLLLWQRNRLRRLGLKDLDSLTGARFESYLRVMFEDLGYDVTVTGKRGDFGGDLLLVKGGERTIVQAKRYGRKVGIKAVQEAMGALSYYDCQKAMVVTNSAYTKAAESLAKKGNVELVDRPSLLDLAEKASSRKGRAPLLPGNQAATTELPAPLQGAVCSDCGQRVSDKVRDYCLTNAQRFGGRVLCWQHQRTSARSSSV